MRPIASTSHFASASAVRRPLVVLTAMVALSGYLAGFVHTVVVQHVRCAEHGEISHRSGDATAAELGGSSPTRVLAQSGAHADDHCLAAGLSSARPAGSALATSAAPPFAGLSLHLGCQLPPPGVPLLAWAPKTSPPALG